MLEIFRYYGSVYRTQGIIGFDGIYLGDTLELPWKDNVRFISCIPEGTYKIHRRLSAIYEIKDCYVIENVAGRSRILIHAANEVFELKGCIAIGEKHGNVVYRSRETYSKIAARVGDEGTLVIKGVLK